MLLFAKFPTLNMRGQNEYKAIENLLNRTLRDEKEFTLLKGDRWKLKQGSLSARMFYWLPFCYFLLNQVKLI